ncbi:MAG: adenylosuccinate synthetase, partial [Neisseriaceae bacterium]|nr:adenylosuccinate synthetase [Neisseriaceae bacterium]
MAKNVVVIGTQWGDEGKGKIVDWLTDSVAAVVRFQGGNNAGHTLVVGGKKNILRLIPSGILHNGVRCFIGSGVVVSPQALFEEIEELKKVGVDVESRLTIAPTCPLILPYHKALDHAREAAKGDKKIGTTGRGIGPAYEDKVARRAVRMIDLFNLPVLKEKLQANVALYNAQLQHLYGQEHVDFEQVYQEVVQYADRIKPLIGDVSNTLYQIHQAGG